MGAIRSLLASWEGVAMCEVAALEASSTAAACGEPVEVAGRRAADPDGASPLRAAQGRARVYSLGP